MCCYVLNPYDFFAYCCCLALLHAAVWLCSGSYWVWCTVMPIFLCFCCGWFCCCSEALHVTDAAIGTTMVWVLFCLVCNGVEHYLCSFISRKVCLPKKKFLINSSMEIEISSSCSLSFLGLFI